MIAERMPKVRLDIRVRKPLMERLVQFANDKGFTRSEAVRWILEVGLDHIDEKR